MLRRQAVSPRVPRGDESSAPQARPNLSMRPEGALLTPSKRGASQPPILFCSPLRTAQRGPLLFDRLRSPHTGAPCVERRTCGAAQMGRGGFAARDGAAGAVQERTRQGGMKLTAPPEDEIPPWTLTGLGEGGASTQPKSPRPRRRGLRGNMVPPSNRARPAVRCRTALPQKRRDFGGADRPPPGRWASLVPRPWRGILSAWKRFLNHAASPQLIRAASRQKRGAPSRAQKPKARRGERRAFGLKEKEIKGENEGLQLSTLVDAYDYSTFAGKCVAKS